MVPIMLRNHDQTIIILSQQYPFLIITKWTNMVEIIWKMGTIIESMPVIFPLNILSSPMDAMSGEQSNFWGNWTNSLWTEIYSGGKIYKDSPTPKVRIESSYCETQLLVSISWVALYSLVCLSVRRGDISFRNLTTSFPPLTIYLHCIAFVQQHHLHHRGHCHHHPCLLCEDYPCASWNRHIPGSSFTKFVC